MCWNYKGSSRKAGDIMVGDVAIAKNLTDKEYVKFIKKATEEASKKVMTLEKYLDELAQIIKAGFRKATKADIDELAKVRKFFGAGKKKNVAFTKGEIGGKKFDLKSRSGGEKGQKFDNFEPISPEKYHYKNGPLSDYKHHTEQKQIEYLYQLFKHNKKVSGKIEVVSDLKICDNCNDIITKFQKDFPNIDVTRVWVRTKLK
tara:strand:+ start:2417 stop:3022 length:606 start_codon:yes stop_codon:yes gene_type:complete